MKADTRKAVEEALDKLGDLIDQLASNAREFDYDTANRMERDAAKALITVSEALLRSEGDAWEPIETAPRDGTEILGYDSRAELAPVRSMYLASDGFWTICRNGRTAMPTHWRPLPTPPPEPGP
jgi:hypothetical protein